MLFEYNFLPSHTLEIDRMVFKIIKEIIYLWREVQYILFEPTKSLQLDSVHLQVDNYDL